MGSGNVAPAPVRAAPLNAFAGGAVVPVALLLLHAPASTATATSAAATEPDLANLVILPPSEYVRWSERMARVGRSSGGGSRREGGSCGPRIPSRGSRGCFTAAARAWWRDIPRCAG